MRRYLYSAKSAGSPMKSRMVTMKSFALSHNEFGGVQPIGPNSPVHIWKLALPAMNAKLVNEAADFVTVVIAFSEPITTQCPGPEPNLVEVGVDDEAMAQADAERGYDGADEDDYEA